MSARPSPRLRPAADRMEEMYHGKKGRYGWMSVCRLLHLFPHWWLKISPHLCQDGFSVDQQPSASSRGEALGHLEGLWLEEKPIGVRSFPRYSMLQWFRGKCQKTTRSIMLSLPMDGGWKWAVRRWFSPGPVKDVWTSCWPSDSTSIEEHRGAGTCVHTPSIPHTHTHTHQSAHSFTFPAQTGCCACAVWSECVIISVRRDSNDPSVRSNSASGTFVHIGLLCRLFLQLWFHFCCSDPELFTHFRQIWEFSSLWYWH